MLATLPSEESEFEPGQSEPPPSRSQSQPWQNLQRLHNDSGVGRTGNNSNVHNSQHAQSAEAEALSTTDSLLTPTYANSRADRRRLFFQKTAAAARNAWMDRINPNLQLCLCQTATKQLEAERTLANSDRLWVSTPGGAARAAAARTAADGIGQEWQVEVYRKFLFDDEATYSKCEEVEDDDGDNNDNTGNSGGERDAVAPPVAAGGEGGAGAVDTSENGTGSSPNDTSTSMTNNDNGNGGPPTTTTRLPSPDPQSWRTSMLSPTNH